MRKLLFFLIALNFTVAQSKAPDFELESINGNSVQLSNALKEGPVFINFWATWCKPCHQEMDELKKLYKKYHSEGIQFFSISIDAERSISKVKPFVKTKKYPFIILLDTNSDVARDYFVQAVPYSVLINKKREIIYSSLGYKKGDEKKLAAYFDKLIKNID